MQNVLLHIGTQVLVNTNKLQVPMRTDQLGCCKAAIGQPDQIMIFLEVGYTYTSFLYLQSIKKFRTLAKEGHLLDLKLKAALGNCSISCILSFKSKKNDLFGNDRFLWAGALVQWLKDQTRNQKVMSSNPGTIYWMDILHIDLL